MNNTLVSWSGGKDSALAFYRAVQRGLKVMALVNFVTEGGAQSLSHGLSSALLRTQADAMGVPLVQRRTAWEGYEAALKEVVREHQENGATAMVFGDIYLREHEEWLRRVCSEAGIEPVFPLWGESTEGLFKELGEAGFEATVVSIRQGTLGQEWIGHSVDEELLRELERLGLDPCGEKGEYHTFVTAGPFFKKRISILDTRVRADDGHWFLDILSYGIV